MYRVCPTCNGAGVITVPKEERKHVWDMRKICPECHGHCIIEDAK